MINGNGETCGITWKQWQWNKHYLKLLHPVVVKLVDWNDIYTLHYKTLGAVYEVCCMRCGKELNWFIFLRYSI
jgi:hypothetical protein